MLPMEAPAIGAAWGQQHAALWFARSDFLACSRRQNEAFASSERFGVLATFWRARGDFGRARGNVMILSLRAGNDFGRAGVMKFYIGTYRKII